MAFLLKTTKFVYTAFRITGRRGFVTRRRNLFLEYPRQRVINLNELSARTTASAAAKENPDHKESPEIEQMIYQLNRNIKYRNILLQNVEEVLKAIQQRGEMREPELTLLLRCCSETAFMATSEERIAMAENIWNLADSFDMQFNINHYNTLLSVFLNNRHKFNINEFFDILKSKHLEPDKLTYRLALQAYCQRGDIDGAGKILVKMKEINHALNEEDFSSLIEGHCQVGDFAKANELLDVMKSRKIIPSSMSYGKLLEGYAKHGKIEELNALLDKLSDENIVIRNSCLHEIVYALAVNNNESHIDSIMERLNKHADDNIHLARIVQRLLHKRMDSLAMKILEHTIRPGMSAENIILRAKFIIKHFVLYREPKEVFSICNELEKKGWARAGLSYALREVHLNKDDMYTLDFLRAMKREGLETRPHYYWPVLIKASKKGNVWMRKILQRIPSSVFLEDTETTCKIIFPNYNFRSKEDFDLLTDIGINKNLLNFCFFEQKLLDKDLVGAERLISDFVVTVNRRKHTLNCLVSAFTSQAENKESFLNILHAFAHDYYYLKLFSQMSAEDEVEEEPSESHDAEYIFDYAIKVLAKRLKNDELFADVLEGMLQRKMGIHPQTADQIASSFKNEKISELVKKLADLESKFQFSRELVRRKIWNLSKKTFESVSDSAKDLVLEGSLDPSAMVKKLGPNASTIDSFFVAFVLGHKGAPKAATEIFKSLAQRGAGPPSPEVVYLFQRFLTKQASYSTKNVLELLNLAHDLGFSAEAVTKIFKYLLQRCKLSVAVNLFSQSASTKADINGCLLPLLIRANKLRNDAAVNKLLAKAAEIGDADYISNLQAIALATSGQPNKGRRLLDAENVQLRQKIFYTHCEMYYNTGTATTYENYLELVKNLHNFDRAPLYKLLLRKYADKDDVQKALALCGTIEGDEMPDYELLKQITPFKAAPTPETLKEVIESFQKDYPVREYEPRNEGKRRAPRRERQFDKKIHSFLDEAATQGKVSDVVELIKKNPAISVRKAAFVFLQKGKIDEFFQFLEHFMKEGNFNSVVTCFNFNSLLPVLKNDEHFQKYKSLAIKCLEEGYNTNPLIHLFVNCVKIRSRLQEAEEIFEQYSTHFRNTPFHKLCQEVKTGGTEMTFYENFVSSDNLKANFSEYFHVIYNRLLKFYCSRKDLTKALHYLEMAVSDSAEKHIERDVLHLLNEKLNEQGKSFPYPELLSTD